MKTYARRELELAPYAIKCSQAGERVHPETDDPLRGPFELDRHRIIECTAFRRLEHKTQVFLAGRHDHFRTRLTHTLEVAQIARCLAVALGANESLAEAIALAHDLGHPPFGHAGEVALNGLMSRHGGFNHNLHSLRVVDYLEHPFPAFRGLNLTRETRAGLASHATNYDRPHENRIDTSSASSPDGRSLDARPSVESQIASLADRIAYNVHDLEDAIGAGLIHLDKLAGVRLWKQAYEFLIERFPQSNIHQIRRAVLDRVLNAIVADAVTTSTQELTKFDSADSVRDAASSVVILSPSMGRDVDGLEQFLMEHVYKHPEVATMDAAGRRMVSTLFEVFRSQPSSLPERFFSRVEDQGLDRVVCDYIAGMTDRYCIREHERLAATTWT